MMDSREAKDCTVTHTYKFGDGVVKLTPHRSYADRLRQGFLEMRNSFTDVTLIVGKRRIDSHKIILASISTYFKGLFCSGMIEGNQKEIKLLELNSELVTKLVEFAYSGDITVAVSDIQELLVTANFLGMDVVSNECVDYMVKFIDSSNVCGIYHIGESIGEKGMVQAALRYLGGHISTIAKTSDFLSLPITILKALLQSELIYYVEEDIVAIPSNQEQGVLDCVLKYVDHDRDKRLEYLPEFLKIIRLPTLFPSVLAKLTEHKLIKESTESLKIVKNALTVEAEWDLDLAKSDDRDKDLIWRMPRDNGMFLSGWAGVYRGVGYLTEVDFIKKSDSEEIPPTVHVKGMKIFMRDWHGYRAWGGYIVTFSNGKTIQHGENFHYVNHEFTLEEDEVITHVGGNSPDGTEPTIKELYFCTNKDRVFGPYGDSGERKPQVWTGYTDRYLVGTRSTMLTVRGKPVMRSLMFKFARDIDTYTEEGETFVDSDNEDDAGFWIPD